MSTGPRVELSVTHRFPFPAERVFEAWIQPEIAGQWLFATPTGTRVRVEIDARVGGKFNITERRDGIDVAHVGEYLAVDWPTHLAFTFGVLMFSAEMTRVSLDFKPTAEGCGLTLTQHDVLPEWAERSREGWGKLLSNLEAKLR